MIRPYSAADKDQLLALLKLNIPKYFDASEEKDFREYLDQHLEDYFVLEKEGKIIASAGINYHLDQQMARLSWDVMNPAWQRKGIGRQLTTHRINHIKKNPKIRSIEVRTSQLAYPFYQKMGFRIEKTVKDYWAKGFDLYHMKMQLLPS